MIQRVVVVVVVVVRRFGPARSRPGEGARGRRRREEARVRRGAAGG
jgi:hypothetical protein